MKKKKTLWIIIGIVVVVAIVAGIIIYKKKKEKTETPKPGDKDFKISGLPSFEAAPQTDTPGELAELEKQFTPQVATDDQWT